MLVGCEKRPKDIKHPSAILKDDRKVLLEDNGTWECIEEQGWGQAQLFDFFFGFFARQKHRFMIEQNHGEETENRIPRWSLQKLMQIVEPDPESYAIEIFYSEEDEGYISVVPELPGCSAFGKTEEALEEIKMAMELWLETAKKEGRKIPQPRGKELLEILYKEAYRTTRPQRAGV